MSTDYRDAEWKRIQEKTFTRWCNQHLRKVNVVIENMEKDFGDGVELIYLLQILSGKSLGRFNKKPRIRAQCLENVELALAFIKKEGIKLVNIGKCFTIPCRSDNTLDRCIFYVYYL